MNNVPIFKVDVFRDIVAGVSLKLTPALKLVDPKITGVHYMHGHPKEIVQRIGMLSKGPTTKHGRFPLIALFQDFPEVIGNSPGYYSDDEFHLIIAMSTEATYEAEDRYIKNFKPILYPTYFEFLEQVRLSRRFEIINGADSYLHTKIDRLYWGREGLWGNEKNVLNDKVDAIEVRGLKLRSKNQNC